MLTRPRGVLRFSVFGCAHADALNTVTGSPFVFGFYAVIVVLGGFFIVNLFLAVLFQVRVLNLLTILRPPDTC